MYRVQIYDKSKKLISTYDRIHTVKYCDIIDGNVVVTGSELLTHNFSANVNYQLLSDNGNYCVDKSVIGTFEVTKVTY